MIERLMLVALALLVAGCAGTDAKLRNTPAFREGYEDGCAAATNAGSDLRDRPTGDRELYAGNDAYRAGYGSGLSTCRRSDIDSAMAPQSGPITLPGPGH
ncbi:MAG TPA: hypothetical protein VGL35_06615 [Rhizomicrobium sp.]|jgi:hypothetical protein